MLGIYFFLKLMLFFAIVKALVKYDVIGDHCIALAVVYTGLIAFISYVFILTTTPGAFNADWIVKANRATGVSPWLIWLAATFLLTSIYFKLLNKFDEGILFWVILLAGVPIAFF